MAPPSERSKDGDSRTNVKQCVAILQKTLAVPHQNPARAPGGLRERLQAACSEQPDSVPRTLLRGGFQVWFAYFREQEAVPLDALSHGDLASVTEQVALVEPHPSLIELFTHFFYVCQRAQQNRVLLQSIGVTAPGEPATTSPSAKRPRLAIQDMEAPTEARLTSQNDTTRISDSDHRAGESSTTNVIAEGTRDQVQGERPSSGRPAQENAANLIQFASPNFDFDPRQAPAYPAAESLGLVFPSYFIHAIVKTEGKAHLKACFSGNPTACALEIWLSPKETPNIVRQLFDVYLTVKSQRRAILLSNDVFIEIQDSLLLSGTSPSRLNAMLGTQAVDAFNASHSRKEEIAAGQTMITRCPSLKVWANEHEASCLRLPVEVEKMTLLYSQLWPLFG